MPAKLKLREDDIKRIRRRVRAGERVIDLADEFGVNRKTIRRRLDALERAESERAERIAEKRLRRQAAREKRKLLERERDAGVSLPIEPSRSSGRPSQQRRPMRDPYLEWLDRRKNLSGRALSEASGFVRVRLPDGSIRKAAEREDVEALLDAGWLLDDEGRRLSPRYFGRCVFGAGQRVFGSVSGLVCGLGRTSRSHCVTRGGSAAAGVSIRALIG